MNWDDLRYFLAVAETESLAGAARRLSVNHSTVFRRINRFEKDVGSRLFERLADGYQLTVAGDELLVHAKSVGQEVDQLQLKILGKDFRPSGTVRMTAPENIVNVYLARYLATFRKDYPDIRVEIDVGPESRDLTRREADLAIRATSTPPPHLVGRRALSIGWSFFASRRYLKRAGRPGSTLELAAHELIGPDGALRQLAPFRHVESNVELKIGMRCSSLNAMSAMAEEGLGIALLPDDQNKRALERLFPPEPAYASELWLLTHPELRKTERVRLLMSHLHQSLQNDPRLQIS